CALLVRHRLHGPQQHSAKTYFGLAALCVDRSRSLLFRASSHQLGPQRLPNCRLPGYASRLGGSKTTLSPFARGNKPGLGPNPNSPFSAFSANLPAARLALRLSS